MLIRGSPSTHHDARRVPPTQSRPQAVQRPNPNQQAMPAPPEPHVKRFDDPLDSLAAGVTEEIRTMKAEMAALRHANALLLETVGTHGLNRDLEDQTHDVSSEVKESARLDLDPAVIFGMERTYLGAMNQAFYLMLLATGLMSMNDRDDTPQHLGRLVYMAAIVHACIAYLNHCRRIKKLEKGFTISATGSLVWLGMLCLLTVGVSVLDLAYIHIYPVLDRAKTVEVVGGGE